LTSEYVFVRFGHEYLYELDTTQQKWESKNPLFPKFLLIIRQEAHTGRAVTSRKPCDLCRLLGETFDQSLPFHCHGVLLGAFWNVNERKCLFGCHAVLPTTVRGTSSSSQKVTTISFVTAKDYSQQEK
jgi:hypothetical protein